MSDETPWKKLHDGKTYKVYRADDDWSERWVYGLRYKVVDPQGDHVAYTWTVRRARRKIEQHRRSLKPLKWWERELVAEVPR